MDRFDLVPVGLGSGKVQIPVPEYRQALATKVAEQQAKFDQARQQYLAELVQWQTRWQAAVEKLQELHAFYLEHWQKHFDPSQFELASQPKGSIFNRKQATFPAGDKVVPPPQLVNTGTRSTPEVVVDEDLFEKLGRIKPLPTNITRRPHPADNSYIYYLDPVSLKKPAEPDNQSFNLRNLETAMRSASAMDDQGVKLLALEELKYLGLDPAGRTIYYD